MAIESIKSFFKGKRESGSQQDVANEKELVGTPHTRGDWEEAERIISSTIDIDLLQKKLRSRLFLEGHPPSSESAIWYLARLVLELRERVLQYDTILSDDASGRLPSLLLRKIINRARDANIPIYFLAGGHGIPRRAEQIEAFLKKKKGELGKVLLVTEYVFTGLSMTNLTDILKKVGIVFDVASVVVSGTTKYEGNIIYGNMGGSDAFFYNKTESGVSKYGERDTAEEDLAHPQRHYTEDSKEERLVREDLDIIAQELVKLLDYEA
ncbi:MAG: hypothetical protein A3A00_00790 [Candidatus Spechtbacteria bacterium RIFCSPLOWO2_01_FULL_38_20]|nr:MAG: hypothetical protein A3A00_00790 [Candidatus Spechtbacteria bacterium RIFCSPLOWO2_01_FULL_38_20]